MVGCADESRGQFGVWGGCRLGGERAEVGDSVGQRVGPEQNPREGDGEEGEWRGEQGWEVECGE